MTRDETLEAISQSKAAQLRDQRRRLKTTEISDQTPNTQALGPESITPEPKTVIPTPEIEPKTVIPEPELEPKTVIPTPELEPKTVIPTPEPRAMPDWSSECTRANVDLKQLKNIVNNLCLRMESQVGSSNKLVEMRVLRLYQSVEDLLLLRAKRGDIIDVFSILK